MATSWISIGGCKVYLFPESRSQSAVSGYSYVPIDPFSVAGDRPVTALSELPDIAVRVSVQEFTTGGEVVFGQNSVGARGSKYLVTVDYINSDTVSKGIVITKSIADVRGNIYFIPPFTDWTSYTVNEILNKAGDVVVGTSLTYRKGDHVKIGTNALDPRTIRYHVFDQRDWPLQDESSIFQTGQNVAPYEEYTIPLYVGIGMRVEADIGEVRANVDITGLGAIGASAEADKLEGSLSVQTLGVSGEAISAALPIQSELNRTTAQNAIVAIGSAKALLYNEETQITPRVVGMYLPFPADRRLVNAVLTSVAERPPVWPLGSDN